MEVMAATDTAQWAAVAIMSVTLVGTLVSNRRGNSKDDAEAQRAEAAFKTQLKADVKRIEEKLADPHTGLVAIKEGQEEQKNHCATVSTGLQERVKNIEKKR